MQIKQKLTWKDIIRVNNKYYLEEFPVTWDDKSQTTFNVDNFMNECAKKHNCQINEIETITFSGAEHFDIPNSEIKRLGVGLESCGGYVNGVAEWLIATYH